MTPDIDLIEDHPERAITNRERARFPNPSKPIWCNGCDACLVREGSPCRNCGFVFPGRFRKGP